ncbi:MAG: dTDP-glucose 4,6-dehydratase [Candidatus Delongbacteria bacterium]|nr:dTDP-glucose 4,6-dehydratase [Candidatus Delongbacteria bacterium]MBN2837060.1 dTDP-glucose 4,6-dehydratase [Candidatus Delongbacteria bacterium]
MKILVTGGAGFIGSNFIHYLRKARESYTIINVDLLTYAGNIENLKNFDNDDKYFFEKADIANIIEMERIFEKYTPDYVVNFAAESHVDRSIKEPGIFVKSNVLGTQILLDLAKKYNVKRFHQVSTDEVYGSLGSTGYFTEGSIIKPNSPYSASKAAADMFVRAYNKTFGFNTVITRCSNNYGPYQFPEKLIPLIINNLRSDKSIPVYGDGMNVRDWLYVDDHCSAILKVLEEAAPGSVYNIGGNNEMANINIVKLIMKHLNKSEELITYVKDRPGHDRRYAIDAAKIKNDLGWEPAYRFEEAIISTIDWYMANTAWIDNVVSGDYLKYYDEMYSKR